MKPPKIEKNIPIPSKRAAYSSIVNKAWKNFLKLLEVNDSFKTSVSPDRMRQLAYDINITLLSRPINHEHRYWRIK